MKAILTAVMARTLANTGWSDVNTLPEVVVESPQVIQNMSGTHPNLTVRAIYEDETNRIWLSSDVDVDSIRGKSTLVHELIHYLQNEYQRRTYQCDKLREIKAYKLQEKYLEDHGIESDINWLFVYTTSRCPPPYAPHSK